MLQIHFQTVFIDLILGLQTEANSSYLKEIILDEVMYDHPIYVKKMYFYILKCLLRRKLFTYNEIEDFITQYKHCSRDELFVLFYTFAHELSQNKSDTYSIYYPKFHNRFFFNSFDVILVDFDKYQQNNWELLDRQLDSHIFKGSIQEMLSTDNLVDFQQVCSNPNFNVNEYMFYSIFSHHKMLTSATPVEIAAFFGSIKIFKFLIVSGVTINERLVHYAVAGGSIEIIRICEQNNLPIAGSFETAVIFRKIPIVQWIKDTFVLSKNELVSSLTQAAIWNSVISFDCILEAIKLHNMNCQTKSEMIDLSYLEMASEKAIENGNKQFGLYFTQITDI
ncbi:hypothetical protein TVAG_459750 [Trichomonas vaginalis G3]|uniref:DUF3447 domain-containing protein n=1 Tax=Trichomonas vaginalis (strain ATCC PRA-98 / G3) TaxID=412133 RepID=A2G2G0_TRIV3|nr:spectrin binding [Trichomonas vaginalis G3]EAX88660.1 hypothetical protein TVAG_459750 [Trichomonas vaginalis G3]KAI5485800.1 spectrin binding [Trichomonas vaginalis G3]|eukprot:XP_001301590.1 hypothetical protein [Trichomonas vaginalis G3]